MHWTYGIGNLVTRWAQLLMGAKRGWNRVHVHVALIDIAHTLCQ